MEELNKLKHNYDLLNHQEKKIEIPKPPDEGLCLIVGSSGSGKSTILKKWFKENDIEFDNSKPVIENFFDLKTGETHLKAFGLRSVPTWFRPYSTLSNGEAHRAFCALSVSKGVNYIDEFTSVIDRDTAKSLSVALRRFVKKGLFVVASCHHDIEPWLCPDIIYDTDYCEYKPRGSLHRPDMELQIISSTFKDWVYFQKHHYLTDAVSKSCHFYTAYFQDKKVAFVAVIHRCGRDIKSYWAESRIVVLPEFQGIGIGSSVSDAVAEEYVKRGYRYFSKTAHPSLGVYRNKSKKWRNTSTNGVKRGSYIKKDGKARIQKGYGKTEKSIIRDSLRVCFSHEFIG